MGQGPGGGEPSGAHPSALTRTTAPSPSSSGNDSCTGHSSTSLPSRALTKSAPDHVSRRPVGARPARSPRARDRTPAAMPSTPTGGPSRKQNSDAMISVRRDASLGCGRFGPSASYETAPIRRPTMLRMATLDRVLDALENAFGAVKVPPRARAFDMLVRMTCGYPASEDACAKGWAALRRDVGISAGAILASTKAKLVRAMRAGGIVPELRADRLVEIASRLKDGADLRSRKVLKTFPTVGDPGADRILLFTRIEPLAAVPSNATQVPLRLGFGKEQRSYAAGYRSAQCALDAELPRTFEARIRAYLLLRRHGETVCKRSRPRCSECPVTHECEYFASAHRTRRAG